MSARKKEPGRALTSSQDYKREVKRVEEPKRTDNYSAEKKKRCKSSERQEEEEKGKRKDAKEKGERHISGTQARRLKKKNGAIKAFIQNQRKKGAFHEEQGFKKGN